MPPPNHTENTSVFLKHIACPNCGSRDNNSLFSDNHTYCFGCGHWEPGDGEGAQIAQYHHPHRKSMYSPLEGDFKPIASSYGIDDKTCRALGIRIVQYSVTHLEEKLPRKGCVAFDYNTVDGAPFGTKVRYKLPEEGKKTFAFPNAGGPIPLWLMDKWRAGGDTRSLVIFEGEGDCAAYYQLTNGKYPCVSVPTGAKGAVDILRHHYEWLDRFDKLVVMFDGDETGREWAVKAAGVLPAGKAYIGEVQGHKDARSALMAGDGKAITGAFFNAEEYKPDGIFTAKDLIDEARKPVVMGMPWWNPTLTKWTFGRRPGELYTLGAGNSIGKTDWTTQSIAFDVFTLKIMTAVFYLEQPPVETLKRLAGKIAGKPFHIPMSEGGYTQAELDTALDDLAATDNLIFGGNFSSTEWEDIQSRIRYLVISKGVQIVYLDNLTALVDASNERMSVETIIKEMALLCQELQINIVLLCHLATPDGKSHEEGGHVSLKHFKGSRAMGAWPHYAFGLERNTQHEDPAMRNYSTFRCVKDRYTGRANGNTMCLHFDTPTGQLVECDFPVEEAPQGNRWSPVDDGGLDL